MTTNNQWIAVYTLIKHELARMWRIATQVFLPPIITTALYFLIFGHLIGDRIGPIQGKSYAEFIAPGLIMMSIITNAYSNVSTSLFNMRFQKSIEELLVSPLKDSLLLCGFVIGGILRGVIVALLVWITSCFFVIFPWNHILLTLFAIILASCIFSLAGFTNALIARNFDDIMLIPTFIIAPLTYLGGVFYTTDMLSPFWQTISQFNPILYLVNVLRYAMIGQTDVHLYQSLAIICIIIVSLIFLNLRLLRKGVGLRS